MKFLVVVLAFVAAAHAQFNYNRASAYSGFGNNYPQPQKYRAKPVYKPAPAITVTPVVPAPTPSAYAIPVAPQAAVRYNGDARAANILKYGNEIQPDGAYEYFFETDNGIAAQAQGTPRNLGGNPPVIPDVVQGSFSWTSPEGQPIAISYIADENGYQPQGAAIPTPPPVPPQILRALDYIARSAPVKK